MAESGEGKGGRSIVWGEVAFTAAIAAVVVAVAFTPAGQRLLAWVTGQKPTNNNEGRGEK